MGMGLSAVEAFARGGGRRPVRRQREAGQAAAETLRGEGHDVTFVRCDVADEDEVKALVESTVAQYGRLDAAFNNAGIITDAAELPDVPERRTTRRRWRVNLDGVWYCMKYELLQMREQGSGAIVNNSSHRRAHRQPRRAAYHATKHASSGSPSVRPSSTPRAASRSTPCARAPSTRPWCGP